MLGRLFKNIIGSKNERELKRYAPIVTRINELEPQFRDLSDTQLRGKTGEFKERIAKGEALDDILPEAYAAVREASVRVLGMRHFDVQLSGGIALHHGRIAEMKTGEGKTLAATLPLYLNALLERGCHLVTVNDYLAKRDAEWMGGIYRSLGMSVGVIVHDMHDQERKIAYSSDITYGTNNEFGFDYLRDNMKFSLEDCVQRELHFAIVDEVDSILIDESRTPLIISGPIEHSKDIFCAMLKPLIIQLKEHQDRVIRSILNRAQAMMREGEDEDKTIELLLQVKRGDPKNARFLDIIAKEPGLKKMIDRTESFLAAQKTLHVLDEELYCVIDEQDRSANWTDKGLKLLSGDQPDAFVIPDLIQGLQEIDNDPHFNFREKKRYRRELEARYSETSDRMHAAQQLIKAYWLFNKDVDYVVKAGQVIIVDEFTGRLMPGRRWSDGLHQAIEAKEGVNVAEENQTLATITFQNYFRMYEKLAGMTGTADTEAPEFKKIYDLDVLVIPTHKEMIREDNPDVIYKTEREKSKAVVEEIKELNKNGQPVLVGTISIEKSERLSKVLKGEGIKHQVLNAKNHEREAEIIAQAGQNGTVTISTNMAGRGTDIVLGDGVPDLGGLHVLGTERHESRRIDNQLRGRSGRQGDQGSSRFYLSLEDDLMRIFGSERIASVMDRLGMEEDQPIEHQIISRAIEGAQKRVEGINFNIRKNLLEYDDVMNQQRKVIYSQRRETLKGDSLKETIMGIIDELVEAAVLDTIDPKIFPEEWNLGPLSEYMYNVFGFLPHFSKEEIKDLTQPTLIDRLKQGALDSYEKKEKEMDPQSFHLLQKMAMLQAIDELWMDHLLAMDQLKEGIGLRGYGQMDPLKEYQKEGYSMFLSMIERIKENTLRTLFRIRIAPQERPSTVVPKKEMVLSHGDNGGRTPVKRKAPKIGRNDPCPCGSGRKYKHCCGR
ncbi:MAG: preprotein translocase subunit SecA [Deltaproteobacteria bacterium]|nr:MAG: preprotein translocase subunit SecA [Deltaproteobacteria bacterium]